MPQFTDLDIRSIKDKIYNYINHVRVGGDINSINTYDPVLTQEQFEIIKKYVLSHPFIDISPLPLELHPLINLAQVSHTLDKVKAKKAAEVKRKQRSSLYISTSSSYDSYSTYENVWGDGY
jgi:hypothetical protein